MKIQGLVEPDILPVPPAEPVLPIAFDDAVTPLTELTGIEADTAPSYVLEARDLASRFPDSVIALTRLAQAEQAIGNETGATDAAKAALDVRDPRRGDEAARVAASTLLARLAPDRLAHDYVDTASPSARVRWAAEAVNQENYRDGISRLEGVDLPSAHVLRGFCLTSLGEHGKAVREFREARKRGRASVDVLVNMGFALAELGHLDKAISITRQAVRESPTSVIASYNLYRYLVRNSDHTEALGELSRLSSARPWDGHALLYYAWAQCAMRKTDDALRTLTRGRSGVDFSRSPLILEFDASRLYFKASVGQISKSAYVSEMRRVLTDSGYRSAPIIEMYIDLLSDAADADELDRVVRRAGDSLSNADRHLGLSKVALLRGDALLALAEAKQAAAEDPNNVYGSAPVLAYLLGEIEGNYEQAAELASAAFRDYPTIGSANNLAFCLALSGRGREALPVLDTFDEHDLPYFGATRALALISIGRTREGTERYIKAERDARSSGDPLGATCIAVRAGLAFRQLDVDHGYASDDAILARWPVVTGDARWTVMSHVAQRLGISAPGH